MHHFNKPISEFFLTEMSRDRLHRGFRAIITAPSGHLEIAQKIELFWICGAMLQFFAKEAPGFSPDFWVDGVSPRTVSVISENAFSLEGIAICCDEQWCDPIHVTFMQSTQSPMTIECHMRYGSNIDGIHRKKYCRGLQFSDFDLSTGWLYHFTLD